MIKIYFEPQTFKNMVVYITCIEMISQFMILKLNIHDGSLDILSYDHDHSTEIWNTFHTTKLTIQDFDSTILNGDVFVSCKCDDVTKMNVSVTMEIYREYWNIYDPFGNNLKCTTRNIKKQFHTPPTPHISKCIGIPINEFLVYVQTISICENITTISCDHNGKLTLKSNSELINIEILYQCQETLNTNWSCDVVLKYIRSVIKILQNFRDLLIYWDTTDNVINLFPIGSTIRIRLHLVKK